MESLLQLLSRRLHSQLRTVGFATWWEQRRQLSPAVAGIESIDDLVAALRCGRRADAAFEIRDQLLRLLIEGHRAHTIEWPATALLLAYSPSLEHAARRLLSTRWGRLLGQDDVESEVVRLFLELLQDLNLETNRDVHTSLSRRLRGRLGRWAEREVRFLEHEPLEAFDELPLHDAERPIRRREGWELDLVSPVLDELAARAVVDDDERRLLSGRALDHQTLRALAGAPANSNRPLSYEATKKRVQRAEARIRAYLDSEELSLVELAIASLERIANSNVPVAPKPGSEKERNPR